MTDKEITDTEKLKMIGFVIDRLETSAQFPKDLLELLESWDFKLD